MNQLATPGLGSLMARRWIAGTGQLLLAVVGFLFIMGWFAQIAIRTYRLVADLPPVPDRFPWMGKVGAACFIGAWLWAWVTTLSVLRQARRAQR